MIIRFCNDCAAQISNSEAYYSDGLCAACRDQFAPVPAAPAPEATREAEAERWFAETVIREARDAYEYVKDNPLLSDVAAVRKARLDYVVAHAAQSRENAARESDLFAARLAHTEFANRIALALGMNPQDEIPFDTLIEAVAAQARENETLRARLAWLDEHGTATISQHPDHKGEVVVCFFVPARPEDIALHESGGGEWSASDAIGRALAARAPEPTLAHLADEALAEHARGETRPIHPTEPEP